MMASISEPPVESFRLSQLLYDTRYRSLTIQVVAFILIMAGLVYLGNNVAQNYERGFNFGFLGNRAGYDINQQLLQYSNDSVHARAALAGILNTLLVAFVGCILATIVGVFMGVMRLSKNWIVARLAAIYVEAFRNVPLLLWILLIFAVFSEALDVPREFREDGDASFWFWGTVAVTNQGSFVPRLVFAEGAFLVFLIAIVAAIGASSVMKRWASSYQDRTGKPVPTAPITTGIFLVALIVAYAIMSIVGSNRDMTMIAAHAVPGQTLADYAAATDSRIDFCSVPSRVSSLNGSEYLSAQAVNFRSVGFGNQSAAIAGFAAENCEILMVASSAAEETIALIQALYARDLAVNETVSGISFIENPDDDVPRREPFAITPLDDMFVEGRAVELSIPEITERGIARFEGGWHVRNSFLALTLALALYTGAFIAEIVRAGIMSVSRGQTEASYALGLKPSWTMKLVILPQALRVIIPPLISQFLNLTKNSSLALAVGYMDVRSTLGGITINQTGRELEGILLMGLFYLTTSLIISAAMNIYNTSVKLKER